VGLCYGFLIMPWVEGRRRGDALPPLDRVLDYLEARARMPADVPGASPAELFDMAIYNFRQHCGAAVASAVAAALGDPHRLVPIPCRSDNRMHAWEWLDGPEGWLKCDGL